MTTRHPREFFINGQWVRPAQDSTFELINPATEASYLRVAEAQPDDMARAIAAARNAFDHGPWPRMSPPQRAGYLRALATAIEKRAEQFAALWPMQVGATIGLATHTIPTTVETFRSYAALAESFPFVERKKPAWGGEVGLVVREPVGVVGAIVPWNSPFPLLCWKTAPALLAGCTLILKASPEAPLDALVFAECVEEVGLPPGVVNVVTADRAVSELLVRSPLVDKITFTGSTAAGKRIASIAGERIARLSLELGGKNAAVILDDADLDLAARALTTTATFLAGQACGAMARAIVTRSRHDRFVDALADAYRALKLGDPFDPTTQVGPLATARQRERVLGYIDKGIAEGARLVTGGKRALDRGYFVEPTVFANVDNRSTIGREEIFGPVICVIPADDEADAVRLANDTDFGLSASVFTRDVERAYQVARQLRSGTVGHNANRGDFTIGWGGFKQSGIGREGGVQGLMPFLESKTVILDGEVQS
ncbi:MAG: aldehyde dehydrogenase [Kofleriaceae bacterium]